MIHLWFTHQLRYGSHPGYTNTSADFLIHHWSIFILSLNSNTYGNNSPHNTCIIPGIRFETLVMHAHQSIRPVYYFTVTVISKELSLFAYYSHSDASSYSLVIWCYGGQWNFSVMWLWESSDNQDFTQNCIFYAISNPIPLLLPQYRRFLRT